MKKLITLIAFISLAAHSTPRCVKQLMNDKEVYEIDIYEAHAICNKELNMNTCMKLNREDNPQATVSELKKSCIDIIKES